MPQRRDYVLRTIEQIGAALIRLREMITGRATPEEVRKDLQATARELGVDLETARVLSAETLAMMESPSFAADPSRCWLIAEVLFLDAMNAEASGDHHAARAGYDKALLLFGLLEPGAMFLTGWPEASARVAEINGRLSALPAAAERGRTR